MFEQVKAFVMAHLMLVAAVVGGIVAVMILGKTGIIVGGVGVVAYLFLKNQPPSAPPGPPAAV